MALKSANLDMMIQDLARATMDDVDENDDIQHGASSASGTALGSNDDDFEIEAAENPTRDDFFDNPFDD